MLLNNHFSITGRSGYLPIQFQFNSSMDLYDKVGNSTQRKYFVSNVNVIKDIDYSHGGISGLYTFPRETLLGVGIVNGTWKIIKKGHYNI